ncbi:MAG: type III pantothenate kinase [Gammaproteobacteria bacterium]|nr:type III pantothenate kinase [Gammaproteobacteria bacterium]MDH3464406.1 type III pantothenate kinase [Gammaproteobacteria bacterium]
MKPTFLLVDAGNTRVKWALVNGTEWHAYACPLADAEPESVWKALDIPDRVIVSNVAGGKWEQNVRVWCKRYWKRNAEFIAACHEQCGVRNGYRNPSTLGSDRWAALIAVRHCTRSSSIVVDCGTTVTVDALSVSGEFLGGVIFPGPGLARAGLLDRTRGIAEVDGGVELFGRSTGEAVAAGIAYSIAGGVDRIVAEFSAQLPGVVSIFMTGGAAGAVSPYLRSVVTLSPELVLRGLAVIAETTR